jgi:hypothetical protein
MRFILLSTLGVLLCLFNYAQDTTIIQTLTYDSTGRDYVFQFPPNDGTSYEKVIMQYSMRCKDGLVSMQNAPNDHGCGEWDYSCNTFITDSSKTDSIKATHASHIISNFSGTTYEYTTQPTYSYYQYTQNEVVYNTVNFENTVTIGNGTESLNHPFGTSSKISKTQYLWTADELITAGLVAGDITGLSLNVLNVNEDVNYLRIRIKSTSDDVLEAQSPKTEGFTEVYFLNTSLSVGANQFNFYNNFTWDGTSNLIVEFSFTNPAEGTDNVIEGHDSGFDFALVNNTEDNYLEFSGSGNVDISTDDFSSVVNEVSVTFWSYGNVDALPANTSPFEAVDADGNREVHSHLPWENSRVYWDCGNVGGYDRIDKAASVAELEGQWHHWAFVKNANTGNMKIYLDGEVWHSGTGKTKEIEIDRFVFGSNLWESYPYYGFMDNFSVWDAELTQEEIQDWMYRDINPTHPKYDNLINYFALDEGTGNLISGAAPTYTTGIHSGVPSWQFHRGKDLFKNFEVSTFRPNLTFIQGDYDLTISPIVVLDSIVNTQNAVYAYQVVGTDLEPVDTNYYYHAIASNVYDESGAVVSTVDNAVEASIDITTLEYYNKMPSVFEIMSFVTPYGLGLDLGMEGKMWEFDVTDLLPILNGDKRLYMSNGGQYQEDIDIRFLFIEGTPARDVIDVQQIWRPGSGRNYTSIMNDTYFEPRTVEFNSEASMFKVRAAITGHGQEGEFIARNHFVNIDGGDVEFQWQVWKECAANPVYPQGGTWVYDRAGWCPGMATDMQEFEITDIISGSSATIDYGVTSGSGDSRYLVNCQLVSYGDPNFTLDAEVVEIQRPSNMIKHGRVNPVCYHPTVVIRNTGSTTLTSLNINFGVSGGAFVDYQWTGSLEFNETATVELPLQSAGFWLGDDQHEFTVTISAPNGGTDEYANNNSRTTEFELPDMYEFPFFIFLKTNSRAWETSYYVKDVEGNTIISRTGFSNNTAYRDTLDLEPGCYTIELFDSGNDGLEWWANSAQGYGYFRLFGAGGQGLLKNFETDFGSEFRYSFVVDNFTNIQDKGADFTMIDVYPNPTSGLVNVDLHLEELSDVELMLTDVSGRIIKKEAIRNVADANVKFDLSGEQEGVYFCRIKTKEGIQVKKVIFSK